jgi:hypothetical protein
MLSFSNIANAQENELWLFKSLGKITQGKNGEAMIRSSYLRIYPNALNTLLNLVKTVPLTTKEGVGIWVNTFPSIVFTPFPNSVYIGTIRQLYYFKPQDVFDKMRYSLFGNFIDKGEIVGHFEIRLSTEEVESVRVNLFHDFYINLRKQGLYDVQEIDSSKLGEG